MQWLYKSLKILLRALGIVLIIVIIFLAFNIGRVNRELVTKSIEYQRMMRSIDSVSFPQNEPSKGFLVGYAKVNLTPSFKTATAGYGNRKGKEYTSVHDSLYVRAIVVSNGVEQVAIVSADLLIIPPTVTRVLDMKLRGTGFTLANTYLSVTHTHNSIGNWGEGATRIIYGSYDEDVIDLISSKIVESITIAQSRMLPSVLRSGKVSVPEAVSNRLVNDGPEDPYVRAVEFHRSDSSALLMMTFSAHATCLYSRDLSLSRDYPGKLIDELERDGYDFAMFMAGAVGSHKPSAPENGYNCIDWMASTVSDQIRSHRSQFHASADTTLMMRTVSLPLPEPQVKVSENWKVKEWLFRTTFGEYPASLSVLRLGDIVMLGTPCDYSGEFHAELDSLAGRMGVEAMVTSFNGGYIGYVTPSKYFDVNHYETQLMNWYPPGTGEYIQDCLKKLLIKASR